MSFSTVLPRRLPGLRAGRARKAPRLIAGLIPEATGAMRSDMSQTVTERRDLIEARADAIPDQALTEHQTWTTALGTPPGNTRTAAEWRRYAHTVAVPLAAPAESTAQKIDAARARVALDQAERITDAKHNQPESARGTTRQPVGPTM